MAEPKLFPDSPTPEEHVTKHQNKEESLQPINTKVNDIATRLKILEERYITLRRKSQLGEQNLIDTQKDHFEELQLLNESLLDVKHTIRDVTEKVSLLSDEISRFATKNEVTILQRYVEFWEPMDFVTRKEINDFLRKKLGAKKSNSPRSQKEEKETK
ncbi:hypothetical protein K9M74_03440 [Candidatus Woesearchaeota archaeon]|nr:hypothetical protein [Candidatus Woesearchaeota archaeon]